MKNLESFSRSTRKHCEYYEQKIAEHTPPRNSKDERMIRFFRRLLIRDRSFLHNLELLKLKEALKLDAMDDLNNLRLSSPGASSSLDLQQIRSLLDESVDACLSPSH